MAYSGDVVYIGIAGTVLALDRGTGAEKWRAKLKGSDFVNVVLEGDQILAATKGELFCIDAASGQVLWNNALRGLGLGVMTIATTNSPNGSVAPGAEKTRLDAAAASAAS